MYCFSCGVKFKPDITFKRTKICSCCGEDPSYKNMLVKTILIKNPLNTWIMTGGRKEKRICP